MGITEQTFYRWKKKYAGLGVAELRWLKQLEEENKKLKQLVAVSAAWPSRKIAMICARIDFPSPG